MSNLEGEAEWEKALWKLQPFPDNYIPPNAFLSALRRNPNFTPLTYSAVVVLSFTVTQHIATIFTLLGVFVRLQLRLLDPRVLVCVSVLCFVLGYVVWELSDRERTREERRKMRSASFKSSILMFLFLVSLSPVLRTLTAATSSDSIWALSAALFSLSALLADYSSAGDGTERLTSVLSINAAMSSSVVLASRLPDDLSVFALMLFATHVFALFPVVRHRVSASATVALQAFVTFLISILALALVWTLSGVTTALFAAVFGFTTVVAPGLFVWAQKYKNEIRGPWDVAVPKVN